MDLDKKSTFVEMHQMGALRQLLALAESISGRIYETKLNSDFSGIIRDSGAYFQKDFECIGDAVNIVKDEIKQEVARKLDDFNKQLKQNLVKAKEISDERERYKELAESILEGNWKLPDNWNDSES